MDRIGHRDPVLEDEVKYRYNSVIIHYRKSFIQDNAQRYGLLYFCVVCNSVYYLLALEYNHP